MSAAYRHRWLARAVGVTAVVIAAAGCVSSGAGTNVSAAGSSQAPELPAGEVALRDSKEWPSREAVTACTSPPTSPPEIIPTPFVNVSFYPVPPGEFDYPAPVLTSPTTSSIPGVLEAATIGRLPGNPDSKVLGTTMPVEAVRVVPTTLSRARGESLRGATVYVGFGGGVAPQITSVYSLRPDGSVIAVGDCASYEDGYLQNFISYGVKQGLFASGAALLEQLAQPDGAKAMTDAYDAWTKKDESPRTPWNQRPTDSRSSLDSDIPPEVLKSMQHAVVYFELTDAWKQDKGMLCTRSSQFWNPCFGPGAQNDLKTNLRMLEVAYLTGEPLEIRYVPPGQTTTGTSTLVGRIDSAELDAAKATPGNAVLLKFAKGPAGLAEGRADTADAVVTEVQKLDPATYGTQPR